MKEKIGDQEERIEELLNDPEILDTHIRAHASPNSREGIGVTEAPRGTLFHHYRINQNDQIVMANLIVSTTNNNKPMNRAVEWVARNELEGQKVTEGLLNHVEVAIRAYDPCLSCATHAMGGMPLIVELHGGLTAATYLHFRFWIYGRTLMAAQGYALLSPNYRGSTGYGDEFMTQLVGRENDIEVSDILAGVDEMIDRGIADPGRLGVMGWSNGGFLTNALIARTDRFKAASSGAGVLDQVLQWAVEDTPGHVVNFMGAALPWQNPGDYVKGSPLYGLASATTPTLIHVGGSDPRVPPVHSRGLYRALKIYLGVPTELVVYTGAHHSLTTYTHREAKMAWDLAWFDRYILGRETGD